VARLQNANKEGIELFNENLLKRLDE